ncbi:hypothetical protein EBB07_14590 [Paenibacillaceae bacterium]|nr:hypothetical protein EBB07_14590 [Paenibacillaceae bacterium]
MEINYEQAYKDDKIIREYIDSEIVFAQKSVEGFYGKGSGTSFEMISNLIGIPNGSSENWQKTIGAHYVYAHSQVSINNNTGMASMVITFYMKDMYNFNKGMSDIVSGTPDDVNGRFAELGWAKEFLTIGSMTRTVT